PWVHIDSPLETRGWRSHFRTPATRNVNRAIKPRTPRSDLIKVRLKLLRKTSKQQANSVCGRGRLRFSCLLGYPQGKRVHKIRTTSSPEPSTLRISVTETGRETYTHRRRAGFAHVATRATSCSQSSGGCTVMSRLAPTQPC